MTAPATAPKETIKIYDRTGVQVAQFRASVSRSWAIGVEHRASMTLATRKTEYVNEDVLRPGNWLYIQNDSLPDWIGVIDFPREWTNRTVKIYAFGPERVFSWRRGPLEEKLNGSAGAIFAQLIGKVNAPETTCIRAGNIWKGGPLRSEVLHPNPLSQNLANIQSQSREEYIWRPTVDGNGRLIVYGDWFYRIGKYCETPLVEGKQGGNIENRGDPLVEDGFVVNDVLGYGAGSTWATRVNVRTLSPGTSLTDYGLRQGSKDWGGALDINTVLNNNVQFLGRNDQPQKTFGVTALNRGETFQYLDLGNQFNLQMQSVGFAGSGLGTETRVRVLGMGYDPSQGQRMQLVLQEIR